MDDFDGNFLIGGDVLGDFDFVESALPDGFAQNVVLDHVVFVNLMDG